MHIESKEKNRLTKTSKRGGGKETKLLCFLLARRETQKKTIDQVYKHRPKGIFR